MSSASTREEGSEIKDQRSETPSTLPGFCLDALAKHNKPDAVSEKRDHAWVHVSAQEFIQRVRHIALGLKDLGIKAGDRVALISENRPDWSIADPRARLLQVLPDRVVIAREPPPGRQRSAVAPARHRYALPPCRARATPRVR